MTARGLRTARTGFSLIEMMVVVVIVGILASVAYVFLTPVTQNAHIAVMKADVRGAMLVQSLYQRQHLRYAPLEELSDLEVSEGVTLELTWLDATGFALTATHAAVPGVVCGGFLGPAPAGVAEPAEREGEIACE